MAAQQRRIGDPYGNCHCLHLRIHKCMRRVTDFHAKIALEGKWVSSWGSCGSILGPFIGRARAPICSQTSRIEKNINLRSGGSTCQQLWVIDGPDLWNLCTVMMAGDRKKNVLYFINVQRGSKWKAKKNQSMMRLGKIHQNAKTVVDSYSGC